MADAKSFEELKEEIKPQIEKGFILDDNKMADLKVALEENGNDISKIDIKNFCKKKEDEDENDNADKNSTTINDNDEALTNENANGSENVDGERINSDDVQWKEEYLHDWREWAQENNLIFEDSNVPGSKFDISFRIYENEAQKKSKQYSAEISYKGRNNVSLKGSNGKIPDEKYFDKAVSQSMKNSPEIEFGDIKSPEFKAKLIAACYRHGATMSKAPSEEEISQWPKELQNIVNQAKQGAKTQEPEKETPAKAEEQESKYQKALSEMKSAKKDVDISAMSDEDKVIYTAAAMNGAEIAFAKNKDIKLIGALKTQDAIKKSKTMVFSDEERKAINSGLTKYAVFEMKQRLSKSKEQSDLYNQGSKLNSELTAQRKNLDTASEDEKAAATDSYEKALNDRFERTLTYKKDENTGETVERTEEEKNAYLEILRNRSTTLEGKKDKENNAHQDINKAVLKKFVEGHSK